MGQRKKAHRWRGSGLCFDAGASSSWRIFENHSNLDGDTKYSRETNTEGRISVVSQLRSDNPLHVP